MDYAEFLEKKAILDLPTGMTELPELPDALFPFQRDIVQWALRRGRAALFAGTGLGKSLMELSWAQAVAAHTGKPVLVLAPLAVAAQLVREADKFSIDARQVSEASEVGEGVNVTNYQKLDHFDLAAFGGIVLDESSILKNQTGHYRTKLVEAAKAIPFRLAATATPAPNDFMELGNHAEFLGVMSYTDMLATFFVHDGGETQKWRLKGHAENEFWRWMASWSVMLRKPSDLGYSNDGYDLPPLEYHNHQVDMQDGDPETGTLFAVVAQTMQERLAARRGSVKERVALAAKIAISDICAKMHEWQILKSDEPTCGHTTKPTKKNLAGLPESKKTLTTPKLGKGGSPIPNMRNISESEGGSVVQKLGDGPSLKRHLALGNSNTKKCLQSRMASALFADVGQTEKTAEKDFALTIVTKQEKLEDYSADHAIGGLDNWEIVLSALEKQSNTCNRRQPPAWAIWCNLNSEQDALAKIFGSLCFSVNGSMKDEEKEDAILGWIAGDRPVMISKPSIMGFGMNFQHCHNTIFVGLNDSWEQFYQAVRRFWRFGQTKPVNVHVVSASTEGATVANIKRKEADADRMAASMVLHMADLSSQEVRGSVRTRADYSPTVAVKVPEWIKEEEYA